MDRDLFAARAAHRHRIGRPARRRRRRQHRPGASATPLGVPNQPKFLANTTLETYLQQPVEPNGCINCHGQFAGKTYLDFQLTNAYPRKPGLLLNIFKLPGVSMQK